ncbi:type I-E CRISPR-associated protein Cas6/Cse3/CasE [Finegoldia magna]|uniref:type I-E CRISPR-associated protein Cas6/Cse3/CasE n=1 Tax=Finegoldia magna TaxID=1260 RepID=UPI0029089C57|nr:type I-E CRISPR-associated protein Cas6/Cse3/CasE [Finegoldia magna]MDU5200670.1 type I-E CRISPR-associated protein Cas6/Cse3/CasE [Finegoldia magna]MDU6775845.1 type I-E CRISPR-associated protein Cas6/Cse3/CasE [Finegoldia magna]
MYLSRVEIDFDNRMKTRKLTHLGAYHDWVERSFPEDFELGNRTRKLWRIDRLNDKYYLLIVSENKPVIVSEDNPEKEGLERYGVSGTGQVKDYDKFLNSIKTGGKMRFRVKLNTVKSDSQEGKKAGLKRGRLFPIVNQEELVRFLIDRSKKNGFKVEEDDFVVVEKGFEKLQKKNMKPLDLAMATYEGNLVVTDEEKFIKTLTEGIGKKKAYGFGMMTVIPIG